MPARCGHLKCLALARGGLGGALGGVHGGGLHGLEVGFGHIGGLLDGLLHRFEGVVGGSHGALHDGDGGFRAGRCVLGGAVDQADEGLLGFSGLGFESLREFGAGALGDVVQVTAVGSGLFSQGLEQAGLQRQQLLGVLDAQGGLGGALGFDQGCDRVSRGGSLLSRLQDGQVQNYLRVIGVALVVLVLFLIWGGGK